MTGPILVERCQIYVELLPELFKKLYRVISIEAEVMKQARGNGEILRS